MSVSLPPLYGHREIARAVATAHAGDRLPSVLLLHGPPGVGKQRFGLWIGQLSVCQAPTPVGPCGACRQCSLATRLEHPDVHWYFPLRRPPSKGSKERDDEALEELRQERLGELRERPLYVSRPSGSAGLHLGIIRHLRRKATLRPAMGPRSLFLIGNAEELAVQDERAEAANALLKLLEEPPRGVRIVLSSSEPGRILTTIRSRAAAIHLPYLPRAEVARFLREEEGTPADEADRAATLSGGSVGRALGFVAREGEDGPLEELRRDAFRLLRAALDPEGVEPYQRALARGGSGGRDQHELLSALEVWLRDLGRVAAARDGAPLELLNQDAEPWLRETVRERGVHPVAAARAAGRIQEARDQAAGNVNPQLLVFGLLTRIRRELVASSAPTPIAP